MNNLKIGVRLAIGFGAMIAVMLIIGVVGIHQLEQTGRALQQAGAGRHPLLAAADALDDNATLTADQLRDMLLAAPPSGAERFAQRARRLADDDGRLLVQLQSTADNTAAAGELETLVAARREFRRACAQVLAAYDVADRQPAVDALFSAMLPTLGRYTSALHALTTSENARIAAGTESALAAAHWATRIMMMLLAIAAAMASAAAFFINRSISGPINRAVELAEAVARGELTATIARDGRTSNEAGRMLFALAEMIERLKEIVADVRSGTDAIATASREIAGGSMDLSARTEHQASSLEQTASSMEELSDAVKQNAGHARAASDLAASACSIATQGGAVIDQVVATMEKIDASSKRVVEIISVIDGIAFQTNILALNAAVEAARAGEQGLGFAVVAKEVRNLAQRSGAAAKEIKALIDVSVGTVDTGNRLVVQAGATMSQIMGSTRSVVDIMSEITAASDEQAQGIAQIAQAIAHMDTVTQQNAALVEQTAAAAQSMQEQGQVLKRAVGAFVLERAVPTLERLPAPPAPRYG